MSASLRLKDTGKRQHVGDRGSGIISLSEDH